MSHSVLLECLSCCCHIRLCFFFKISEEQSEDFTWTSCVESAFLNPTCVNHKILPDSQQGPADWQLSAELSLDDFQQLHMGVHSVGTFSNVWVGWWDNNEFVREFLHFSCLKKSPDEWDFGINSTQWSPQRGHDPCFLRAEPHSKAQPPLRAQVLISPSIVSPATLQNWASPN